MVCCISSSDFRHSSIKTFELPPRAVFNIDWTLGKHFLWAPPTDLKSGQAAIEMVARGYSISLLLIDWMLELSSVEGFLRSPKEKLPSEKLQQLEANDVLDSSEVFDSNEDGFAVSP
ncbi:hypothetical protein AB205_0042320 [Aquarana catesbeiana]|uniref:Uncharacterized protein n=1 Tax=Aquarana catesbeiana TaxID=8400 RepID=A0A2G9RTL7_AQUCT|nr:hypothetical protein AB205_0042320 [Aquarana catesbeiana]